MATSSVCRAVKATHAHTRILCLLLGLPDSLSRLFACVLIRKFPVSYSRSTWMRFYVSGLHSSKESRCIALLRCSSSGSPEEQGDGQYFICLLSKRSFTHGQVIVLLSVLVLSVAADSTNKTGVSTATFHNFDVTIFETMSPKERDLQKKGM